MRTLGLGWRNLWRNRSRTLITLAAVAGSTAIMIILMALTWGIMTKSVDDLTQVQTGEVQVHAPGYLADHSLYKTVRNSGAILRAASHAGAGGAARAYGYGLVSRGVKSAGAMFLGVEPGAEAATFRLHGYMERGEFLSSRPRKGMVLGRRLAKSLDARVGSEIIAVVQGADGSLGNELFTVTGILKSAGEAVDRNAAIIHRRDFEELFTAPGMVHEVALTSKGRMTPEALRAAVTAPAKGMDVRTWKELVPMMADMLKMLDAMFLIFGGIFFLASGLGVLNTMLMATNERVREFGVLRALGTPPWRIVLDVTAEAFMLGVAGSGVGAALGIASCWYLSVHGIDMTPFMGNNSLSVSGMVFDPVWKATLTAGTVMESVGMMLVTCVLAALYPAWRISRLRPVEAMTRV